MWKRWMKTGVAGLAGALVMFVLLVLGTNVTGLTPFEVPPSKAFLFYFGLESQPFPAIVHFGYGMLWSIVLVAMFGINTTIQKGLIMSGVLWLIMMVVYSPILGWGFFGFGATGNLPAALELGSPITFIVSTAVIHALYGLTMGWINQEWLTYSDREYRMYVQRPGVPNVENQ